MFGQTLGIKFKWVIFALDLGLAALLIGRLRPVISYLLDNAADVEVFDKVTYGDIFAAVFVALMFSCLIVAWMHRLSSHEEQAASEPMIRSILNNSIYVIAFLEFAATFSSFVQEYGNAFSTQPPSLIDYVLHGAVSISLVLAHLLLSYLTAVAVLDLLDRTPTTDGATKAQDLMRELENEG